MQELPRRLSCGGSNRLFHQPPLCSAGHGDPGEYERWVKRTITSEFVTWVKNGETGLNNYVDHGRPGGDGRTGGEDLQTMSLCSGNLSGGVSQKSRAHRPTMQTTWRGRSGNAGESSSKKPGQPASQGGDACHSLCYADPSRQGPLSDAEGTAFAVQTGAEHRPMDKLRGEV